MENKEQNVKAETALIASDLKSSGFGVEILARYDAVRVRLTRKVSALPWQVRVALYQAGYEDGAYRITEACGSVFVRAVVA